MGADRPTLGVLLMLGFCVTVPFADALAKILGQTLPLLMLIMVRFAAQVVLFCPAMWWRGTGLRLTPAIWRLMLWRAIFHIAGLAFMFAALRVLPLAEAIAIAFVMPFLLLLAGWLFLREEVGPRRIAACAVGFTGTLLVLQPNLAEVGLAALLPLGVAVAFTGFMLVTRRLATACDAFTLQGVSGAIATAILALLLIPGTALHPDLGLARPTAPETWMLLAFGLLGAASHMLMTLSLRFAPASTLAPMQYLEIPMATLVGWAVFGALPDGLALAGIAVTIAAGLYIVFRERNLARAARIPQAPLDPARPGHS